MVQYGSKIFELKNPFLTLIKELHINSDMKKESNKKKFRTFNMHHVDIHRRFMFLKEIWRRILNDVELDLKNWQIRAEVDDPNGPQRMPTEKEVEILQEYKKRWFFLHLNYEDFFIHAKILMDKLAHFSTLLMKMTTNPNDRGAVDRIRWKSFSDHQKSFFENKNIPFSPDEEYAKYVREKTTWYEKQLKNIRDDFIVHEHVPKRLGTTILHNEPVLIVSKFSLRNRRDCLEKLYQLREGYKDKIPEIKNSMNFWELLTSFERNREKLSEKDVKKVKDIQKKCGGRFPDIPSLFSEILAYMIFINNHFLKKIKDSKQHKLTTNINNT